MPEEKTLGEARVRVSFNPSDDPSIDMLKMKTAELIDRVGSIPASDGEVARLKALAMTAYEEAAMWAVKAATAGK